MAPLVDDCFPGGAALTTVAAVLETLLPRTALALPGTETVALRDARGRSLASGSRSPIAASA
jgi:hypothetical protein